MGRPASILPDIERGRKAQGQPQVKEADIQRAILDLLMCAGIFAWRNHTQGVRVNGKRICNPSAGAPDILGVTADGRIIGIEVKTRDGRVSVEQGVFLEEIGRRGGVAILARSVDDVIPRLEEMRGRPSQQRASGC